VAGQEWLDSERRDQTREVAAGVAHDCSCFRMGATEQAVAEFLEPYPAALRSLAQDLRGCLKKETRPANEPAGMSPRSFNIGFGFKTTAWDFFCTIIGYRKHINLSLPSGARPEDPENLLHGTGSRVRPIKVKSVTDVETPASRAILKQARTNALDVLLSGAPEHQGAKTFVKRRAPE